MNINLPASFRNPVYSNKYSQNLASNGLTKTNTDEISFSAGIYVKELPAELVARKFTELEALVGGNQSHLDILKTLKTIYFETVDMEQKELLAQKTIQGWIGSQVHGLTSSFVDMFGKFEEYQAETCFEQPLNAMNKVIQNSLKGPKVSLLKMFIEDLVTAKPEEAMAFIKELDAMKKPYSMFRPEINEKIVSFTNCVLDSVGGNALKLATECRTDAVFGPQVKAPEIMLTNINPAENISEKQQLADNLIFARMKSILERTYLSIVDLLPQAVTLDNAKMMIPLVVKYQTTKSLIQDMLHNQRMMLDPEAVNLVIQK